MDKLLSMFRSSTVMEADIFDQTVCQPLYCLNISDVPLYTEVLNYFNNSCLLVVFRHDHVL